MADSNENSVLHISNFLEDVVHQIYGFTVTFDNGKIKNYFVQGEKKEICKQIEDLKVEYQQFKNKRRKR